jgi:SAM-dependent methyltransferase
MAGDAAEYIGNIPQHYDRNLGPLLFADYAADISRRVAAYTPRQVLEIAAGTGIVTRQLRNLFPAGARLTATDLNPPILEIAKTKFLPEESVEFQPADAKRSGSPHLRFREERHPLNSRDQFYRSFYSDEDAYPFRGRVRMRKSTYIPDAGRSEMIELPVSCALLRQHSQGNTEDGKNAAAGAYGRQGADDGQEAV